MEGGISPFGQLMDKQVDRVVNEKPTGRVPPSPPPQHNPSFVPSDIKEQVTQLQGYCMELLIERSKHENIIDCMRVRDMINQKFSPPKLPEHTMQSGPNQRANIYSDSIHSHTQITHQESASTSWSLRNPNPQVGQVLAQSLYDQAYQFSQQLKGFEDLQKGKTLMPAEQVKRLSQLGEALDSLERGYMSMRREQGLLLQEGVKMSPFDPKRELEGMIFQFGLYLDGSKEDIVSREIDQLYSLPPYVSPSNDTGTSSGVRGRKETRRRSRRSLSTDEQRFVDNSLDRAIREVRHMKLTSGHMARSLAAGLHHQERLNQSCS